MIDYFDYEVRVIYGDTDKMGISYFTVNNHVKKVYEKLQVHSLGEAVALAHKQKLL